jgi:lipoate-protein ligase A
VSGVETRIARPGPTVAFGRLDRLRPGYENAIKAAERHGFAVLEREPGGHAVAYHHESLIIEIRGPGGIDRVRARFEHASHTIAQALRSLGVDARIGAIDGEYCPGDYSVNDGGRVKLAGLAQRVRHRRFLLGASLVCADPEPVQAVLVDVYAALDLEFDPATVGVPGPPTAAVEQALREAFGVVDTQM